VQSRIAPLLLAPIFVLGGATLPAAAQIPPGYYDGANPSTPATLRATLHGIIDDHLRFPYTSGGTDTWDILELADQNPAAPAEVLDVYRNGSFPKQGGGNPFYSREHLWPSSFGFPDDGAGNYPFSDCHGLYLCDDVYNSARANKPFRNCDPGCAEFPTDFNGGQGGGSGAFPGQSNWTSGFGVLGTWQTWAGRRGDVARALLYLDVRYEGGSHGFTGAAEPDLRLTNDETLIDASNTGVNESVAYMGLLDVLLAWHGADPVDDRERERNDVVHSFQGNRNPFVDHPEWVAVVYATGAPAGTAPWINELHYDNDGADQGEFVELAGPAGLDLTGYRLVAYNGGSGLEYDNIDLSGVLPDQGGCLGTASFPFPGLQNGSPDGLALVDATDAVLEFWSYEGSFVAVDGPAFGQSSTDLGVAEPSDTPLGSSLQRLGSGVSGANFSWSGPASASPGAPNVGQTFGDACAPLQPAPPEGVAVSSCGGLVLIEWQASSDPTVTGYDVLRASPPGGELVALEVAPLTATHYTDSSAAAGATYDYAVRALAGALPSNPSAPVTVTVQGGAQIAPWINEFHYDNASTDVGEFVEVAGPAGLSLAGYGLLGYNGSDGQVYATTNLSGTIPDQGACRGTLSFPFTGLQNGSPDGLALVDPQGTVLEFLSYEGSFVAVGGPAAGLSAVDVGVSELSSTPVGQSLQRSGVGSAAAAFALWSPPATATPGLPNLGQAFVGGCAGNFTTLGCGVNPAGSLGLLSGAPQVGATLVFGIDNPTGGQTPGSFPVLVVSLGKVPGAPCGPLLPGYGMSGPGAPGELIASLTPGVWVEPLLLGAPWSGPGQPAPIPLTLPLDCVVAGLTFFVQGALVDPFSATGIGLTEGGQVQVAP
jgi:endonuclease I